MTKQKAKAIMIGIIVSTFLSYPLHYFISPIDLHDFQKADIISMLIKFILVFYIYNKNDIKISNIKQIGSAIIAFLLLLGEIYMSYHTITIITTSILTILIVIGKYISYYYLIKTLYYYIDNYLIHYKKQPFKIKNKYLKKYLDYFNKYPFKTSFFTILLCWSIILIAFYPGVLSPDPYYQIIQYLNIPNKYIDWVNQVNPNVYMTAHHPAFHTYLLGFCFQIGRNIWNDNFGFFIYVLIQTLFFSSVLSATIVFLKKHQISTEYRFILLLIYLFVPSYGFYTVSFVKDVYYSLFMMLFVLFIYEWIKNKNKKLNIKEFILLTIIIIMISAFRHNGTIITVVSMLVLIIYSKKRRLSLIACFTISFIIISSWNNIIIPKLGISPASKREMLSVLFQQTARYTKYYGNEQSKKEKEVINKVLDYERMEKNYNPELADPIKNKYKKEATEQDLKNYYQVWFQELKKHPTVYIDSFINNTYGYYYPNKHSWYIYSGNSEQYQQSPYIIYRPHIETVIRNVLVAYGNVFPFIPVIGLLVNIGINTFILIIVGTYIWTKKQIKYFIVLLPLYLSLAVCLAGPANTYFRYAMPYMYVLPCLIIVLVPELAKNIKNKEKNKSD